MDYADFLTGVYQDQLGRTPDSGGLQWYTEQLTSGAKTPEQVIAEINQSLEGQNYDTQLITSEYRQSFGRDPEQEGYQYWMTRAQTDPSFSAAALDAYIRGGATGEDIQALASAPSGYTEFLTASLQADPWAGRRATQDIYGVSPTGVNVSRVGDAYVQFVNPVTQAPIVSTWNPETQTFTSTAGADVLDPYRVANAIQIASGSGALSKADAQSLYNELRAAKSMDDVYAALSKPQAGVVIDQLYGMQLGEDADMQAARQEALARQKVLDNFNYAPAYDYFGQQLEKAGIKNPFDPKNYTAKTMAQLQNLVTPENFSRLLGETVQQSFGNVNYMPTEVPQGFYSERGLETGYIPLGEGPTFRSGVSGYVPTAPTGIEYGAQTVQAPINLFTPGIFNANATGYNQLGEPIFGDSANQMASGSSYLNNPIIGRAADGSPIYAAASTQDYGGA